MTTTESLANANSRMRPFALAAATLIWASLAIPAPAHAETPLEAFCADNVIELERTNNEMGLDPGKWANDPENLARFGYSGAGYTDDLYQAVISAGAPAIESYWSNLNSRVEWRCEGQ